jgi:hypothetical protein
MQKNKVFEYAIIRVVPKVEREEFINVGVILFCKELDYLEVKIKLPVEKIKAIAPNLEIWEIEENLKSFLLISEGLKNSGPIGELNKAERFRWLTATRSTIIQSSKVHPGFCFEPKATMEKLFLEMVD